MLDGESRSTASRKRIEASSNKKLQFLDYRMLENHLLFPEAVAATLQELGVAVADPLVESELC
ncbi:hypothetical protein, partial [Staphylococcus sp. J]|uniref:hypothetical protein n=1 Tax=Staphylococcus sp. J TaxID=2502244 RepID=UPI001BB1DC1C